MKCDGDYRRRLGLMAAQLRELSPDLVLLQEVFCSADHRFDTAAYLGAKLGLYCGFHAARHKVRRCVGRDVASWSGLAVLSRFAPGASGALRLAEDPRDGDRWAQWLDIETNGVTLRLINTHLCHLVDREDLRMRQLEQVVAFAAGRCPGRLVLMGGDLNTGPKAPALRWLARQRTRVAHSAWVEVADGESSATYPANNPVACLDHLYRFESLVTQARWDEVKCALNMPALDGCYPSDHAAVHAVLRVGDAAAGAHLR